MRMRRIGMAALASAVALGGMVVGIDPASAGKPSLSGTLTCHVNSTITISPSLVLSIPDKKPATATKPAKPGKDKGPKFNSTGSFSQCAGSEPSSGLAVPTGAPTTTTKSKGGSRLCAGGPNSGQGISKGKITFSDGSKAKASSTTSSLNAYNPVGPVITPTPPSGSSLATSLAFVAAHATDRLYFTTTATSGGKAYKGKHFVTQVVTTETIQNLFLVQCSGAGISALHLDPAYSRFIVS
jgi:hypothetical protein